MTMTGATGLALSEAEKTALVRRELVAMLLRLAHLDGLPVHQGALIAQGELINDLVAVVGSEAAARYLRHQADLCEAARVPPDPAFDPAQALATVQPAGRA